MILEPNTKFSVVALAETNSDFDGSVVMPPHYVFATTCPFELDSAWQHWLGSIAVDDICQSDFFMVIHEPARQPGLLDDQNVTLLSRAESTLMVCIFSASPVAVRVMSSLGLSVLQATSAFARSHELRNTARVADRHLVSGQ